MKHPDLTNIQLEPIGRELRRYAKQWVAISPENKIVASGKTYHETLQNVDHPEQVILMKVPPADATLAPHHEVQVPEVLPRRGRH